MGLFYFIWVNRFRLFYIFKAFFVFFSFYFNFSFFSVFPFFWFSFYSTFLFFRFFSFFFRFFKNSKRLALFFLPLVDQKRLASAGAPPCPYQSSPALCQPIANTSPSSPALSMPAGPASQARCSTAHAMAWTGHGMDFLKSIQAKNRFFFTNS